MTLAVGGGVLVVLLDRVRGRLVPAPALGPAGMALAVRSGFAILLVALASGAAMIARGVVLTRTGHQEAAYHSTAPLKPLHGVEPARRPGPARAGLAAVPHALERAGPAADRRAAVGCYAAAVVAAGVLGRPHLLSLADAP